MKLPSLRPQEDAQRRRRRADLMIHALVERLAASGGTRVPVEFRQPPAAPPGHRSGEGASSVLPYLKQSRQGRARPQPGEEGG